MKMLEHFYSHTYALKASSQYDDRLSFIAQTLEDEILMV